MYTFFSSFVVQQATAQINKIVDRHSINAGIGTRFITDDFLSFDTQKMTSAEFGYTFSANTPYWKKSISLSWGHGVDKNENRQTRLNDFEAQYSNAFSLKYDKARMLNTYLGYSINAGTESIKWGDKDSWATINSLSVYYSTICSWQKNSLSLDINIALAGLASRPENLTIYAGDKNGLIYNSYSNLFFTAIDKLKAATILLKYEKELGEHFQLNINSSFVYKNLNSAYNFKEQSLRFNMGVSYSLKYLADK